MRKEITRSHDTHGSDSVFVVIGGREVEAEAGTAVDNGLEEGEGVGVPYPSVLSVVSPEFGTAAASLIPSCNDDISAMALLADAEVWVEGVVVKCLSIAAK